MDTELRIGEAREHQYDLNPTIDAGKIASVEATYQVSLPPDYKCFLLGFANGGAGPGFGLFTIDEAFERHLTPHLPFPYETAMRVVYADTQTEEELKELCAFYDDPRNEHGKLVLGELGCGAMMDLIVTGPARGQVWIDDRSTEWGGLYPFDQFDNSSPLSFMNWYEVWLDRSLGMLE